MTELVPNHDVSVDFLRRFRPDGPWILTAILPDSKPTKIVTATFSDLSVVPAWLNRFLDHNIYFSVNPCIYPMAKKPSRQDVARVEYLHVDIDPRVGEDLATEQPRILKLLTEFKPVPTFILFSGGGYQGFWRLAESLPVDGNLEKADDLKRYNTQLELLLGGDDCGNLDRIMRLPGTVNRPDERKRKKGRAEAVAAVVAMNPDAIYTINTFTMAPPVASAEPRVQTVTNFAEAAIHVPDNIERIESVDTLPLSSHTKVLIVQGNDPDNPDKYPSRSHALFAVCCDMVRAKIPDETIYAVITDPGFGISASVLDKGASIKRYAIRQIASAHSRSVSDPQLKELNSRHAVIGSMGGKCRIISEEWDWAFNRPRISKQSFDDFERRYMNRFVEVGEDRDGNPRKIPLGKWWLLHPLRTQFDSMVFAPGRDIPAAYNLWKGFAVQPKVGDCGLFLSHLKDVICEENDEYYDYLIGWMASAVQHPDSPGTTAVVLRGGEGVGKGFFASTFGKLFGRHFLHVVDSKHLVGNFNAHLRDCVVLFADEAFYAGDRKGAEVLKSLVTESQFMIEPKGIDPELCPNFLHIIIASNNQWVVPAATDARRWFVLDVNGRHKEDYAYFQAIAEQMECGGYEALLYFLQNYDISKFNVRKAPRTNALDDQKELSFSAEQSWWYDKLQEGRLLSQQDHWIPAVSKLELLSDYRMFVKGWPGSKATLGRLTTFLRRICPMGFPIIRQGSQYVGSQEYMTGSKPWVYEFPPLAECRKYWDSTFGFHTEWQAAEEGPIESTF